MYIIHYLTNNVLQIAMQWKLGWVTAEIKKKNILTYPAKTMQDII